AAENFVGERVERAGKCVVKGGKRFRIAGRDALHDLGSDRGGGGVTGKIHRAARAALGCKQPGKCLEQSRQPVGWRREKHSGHESARSVSTPPIMQSLTPMRRDTGLQMQEFLLRHSAALSYGSILNSHEVCGRRRRSSSLGRKPASSALSVC